MKTREPCSDCGTLLDADDADDDARVCHGCGHQGIAPSPEDVMPDPFALRGLERSVERVLAQLTAKEREILERLHPEHGKGKP